MARAAKKIIPAKVLRAARVTALNAAQSTATVNLEQSQALEHPKSVSGTITRARHWVKESSFLSTLLPLKRSICNYGFELAPADSKDQKRVEEWLAGEAVTRIDSAVDPETGVTITPESTATIRELVSNFAQEVWWDYNLFDAAISVWDDAYQAANTLPIETVTYQDKLGIEFLRYTHGLAEREIALLPDDRQTRYRNNSVVVFDAAEGEHFKVLKRARIGDGLGEPSIFAIFRILSEVDDKQVGQRRMAHGMRRVTRLHRIGHEIKQGNNAGKPLFHLKKKQSDATKKLFVGVDGFEDTCVNFDHFIEFPWPDLKVFDKVLWEGSDHRLYQWAGPIGQMITATQERPFLPNLLRAHVEEERGKVGEYLSAVINKAFRPPSPIKVVWSDLIFQDARLQAEMMKFGVSQGFVSIATARQWIGVNGAREDLRKITEADDPDAEKKFLALWDSSHGISPAKGERSGSQGEAKGAAPGTRPGKKPGTKDAS